MGLPSLELTAKTLECWQDELCSAGYSVVEEALSSGPTEIDKQTAERMFLVQSGDDWVRILEYRKLASGEAGLVAMTHQQGCHAGLAGRIFAHLRGASLGENS